jgi:hypothetical protein
MFGHRGRSPTTIGIKVILHMVSKELNKWCPSKLLDSSVNHLSLRATLCIKRCTPFIEIDDIGGELSTKI